MRLADGVLLVVDAAEGVMAVTERAVRQAVSEGLAITLLISKARCVCVGGQGLLGKPVPLYCTTSCPFWSSSRRRPAAQAAAFYSRIHMPPPVLKTRWTASSWS